MKFLKLHVYNKCYLLVDIIEMVNERDLLNKWLLLKRTFSSLKNILDHRHTFHLG